MWPFSTIKALRRAHGEVLMTLRATEASLLERERQLESLRHDYEVLRADYGAVVQMLGGMAQRPTAHRLFDDDIFKEDPKQPDVFLSPAEDELGINYDDLMNEVTGAAPAN